MIVCSCNVLSDHEMQTVVTIPREEPLSADELYGCPGCSNRMRCAFEFHSNPTGKVN
jgi:bacterioferritin-associated ferredoxin